jgi:DNA (cytosine-5)-methyltransferase 1
MRVGSLFTGIGGFDLGLERAGMEVAWQVECDPFCRTVLRRHWPHVPCYGDVRAVADPGEVEVLCGGFPCQDLARVGRRAGFDGAKSVLWGEFARLIGDLRPSYVIVENVPTILSRGRVGRVLGDLAARGYDAEWDCLPAQAIGALHPRDRFWLLAYPRGRRHRAPQETVFAGRPCPQLHGWWADEPRVDRVAHGLPDGVDRRRAIGNALVPQIAEHIGRCVMQDAA